MHATDTHPPTRAARPHLSRLDAVRTAARWMATFAGFPLGGFAALLIVGPVNGPAPALLGGLITGALLGAVQVWGLLGSPPPAARWLAATAIVLAVGLGIGAAAVGYRTDLASLLVQGAVCGITVGAAQGLVLRNRLGRLAFAWPPALSVIWAVGWAVTTEIGVQVDEQFTVFGSAGALVVAALTAVLPLALARNTLARNATSAS
jgi:hypothetical protein